MSDPAYDEPWRDAHEPWRASLEPWRASLARSRARRGKEMPSSSEMAQWTAARKQADPPPRWTAARTIGRQRMVLLASPIGLLVLIVLAAVLPSASDGFAVRVLAMSGHRIPRAAIARRKADTPVVAHRAVQTQAAAATRSCERTSASGYVNPLADAVVTPKRIDQGVDYTAGSGVLRAIGPGTVTVVATTDTGWPGAFIEYRLNAGPAAGCSVFYAEGVEPITGLAVGDAVQAGTAIASIVPGWSSGIEIGWGAGSGTATYAAKMGEWSAAADADSIPTAAGESFSLLIASLGGPPGRLENTRQ